MSSADEIIPVVLAGGGGTRLWPMSRGHYPKQFLRLNNDRTLLQDTLLRMDAGPGISLGSPVVVCNEEHRFLVAEQCRELDLDLGALLLEPAGRNTAPAMTAAAAYVTRDDKQDPILVMMPADHIIANRSAFGAAIAIAVQFARDGKIVTLGVTPSRAETGYGYIELGASLRGAEPAAFELKKFREKPDRESAQTYLASGNFLWNAGLFVVRASVWLGLINQYAPEISSSVRTAVNAGRADGIFFRLDSEPFAACPSDSIDYAVMEPLAVDSGNTAVVQLDAGWSDVGSWSSLWQIMSRDDSGNFSRGDVCALDSRDSVILAEHRLVATIGCENLVIVETADAVLVADRDRAEEVKGIVDWLTRQDREERLSHRRVFRPWGYFENVDAGPGFKVKKITVNAGSALSLQKHERRAEHWVVVSGTATVTLGDRVFELQENESTFIPIGEKHRLENRTMAALALIEVQSGDYLGEDDIVRFEDRYARV